MGCGAGSGAEPSASSAAESSGETGELPETSSTSGVETEGGTAAGESTSTTGEADTDVPPDPEPSVSCDPTAFVTVDAAGGGDGSMQRPWTLAEAMAAAVAGDVVEVGPGVYTAATTGERYIPAWNPTNSGNEGEPIVFCARHAAVHTEDVAYRSELRNDATEPNEGSPTFGTLDRSHIVWDGFYVDEHVSPSRADTGPVTVWGSDDITVSRCVVEGAEVDRQDNHNGVRLEAVTRIRLVDNLIFGVRSANQTDRNHAAITTYDASDITIEHNEIRDCTMGMYLKGDHADDGLPNGAFFVRRNYVHDVELRAVEVLGVTLVGDAPSDISHNLFVANGTGVGFNNVADDHPAAVRVHHNTIVDSDSAILVFPPTMLDVTVSDNLVSASPAFYTGWDGATVDTVIANGFDTNHNFGDPSEAWISSEADYVYDLSTWQASSGLDGSSSVGDPMFVGAGDYHLAPESAARTASSSGGPVGCFVEGDEVIGVRPAN